MKKDDPSPAKQIEDFLNFIEEARTVYKLAQEQQKEAEKRETDFSHELEFAHYAKDRNRAAGKLQKCLRERRRCKDQAHLYQQIVIFFEEDQNQRILNRMKQLLGRQRREEEYLNGDRVYKNKA